MGKKLKDIEKNCMDSLFGMSESKRRSNLHMDVRDFEPNENFDSLVLYGLSSPYSPAVDESGNPKRKYTVCGGAKLDYKHLEEKLRCSKMYLGMRFSGGEIEDRRAPWNREKYPAKSNLDLFSGVKHSYSTALPSRCGMVDLVVSDDGKRSRFCGITRSGNMRLDPLDAPRIAYRRRKEINRAIAWGHFTGNIPVMMTLTVPHRWATLKATIAVLRKSYDDLFGHKIGVKLKTAIGFKYRIYRMEETLDESFGWHPHYHVILFVPRENLNTLSDLEPKLKKRWSKSVRKYYREFVGKELPEYDVDAMYKHGLVLSRYDKDSREHRNGELREVDNGDYMAKIMGCDDKLVYGGDAEMTATTQKDTMIPFDLLGGECTANKVDLWNEYAIATKGLSVFRFTPGFKAVIDEYFEKNPQRDPDKTSGNGKSSGGISGEKKPEKTVGIIPVEVYKLFAQNFMLKNLKKQILEGYDALCAWLKKMFVELGVPQWCDNSFYMPRPPDWWAECMTGEKVDAETGEVCSFSGV